MDRAIIMALGNISEGDFGLGCYVVEILSQTSPDQRIHTLFMGDDPRLAGSYLYEADLAFIVGTLDLGGVPGSIHCWSYAVFRQHAPWLEASCSWAVYLSEALSRLELAEGLPKELIFIWVEPKLTEGFTLSDKIRRSLWRVIHIIGSRLVEAGFRSEHSLNQCAFPRLEFFSSAHAHARVPRTIIRKAPDTHPQRNPPMENPLK